MLRSPFTSRPSRQNYHRQALKNSIRPRIDSADRTEANLKSRRNNTPGADEGRSRWTGPTGRLAQSVKLATFSLQFLVDLGAIGVIVGQCGMDLGGR